MPGGLMNIVAYGNENIYFNGNPKKTFFRASYNKYTNFGMQKLRIDHEGNRQFSNNNVTIFDFKVPRYGDLLHDTYLVINLPDIYSPFYYYTNDDNITNHIIPYEFKWVKELGTTMINNIEVFSGGVSLARFPGEYLSCMKERDFTEEKKKLWDRMIGNIPELNDPGNSNGNFNTYPNVIYSDLNKNVNKPIEPSIRGRQLYIPLDIFFCNSSKMSLPLIALQYQDVTIRVEIKPFSDLYTLNNIDDVIQEIKETNTSSGISHPIRPNIATESGESITTDLWKFLQPPSYTPKDIFYEQTYNQNNDYGYNHKLTTWNADVHLMSTYIFLDNTERRLFSANEQMYLIKQVYVHDFTNIVSSGLINIESKDMVANYMWRFRRNDSYFRNEWTNYTNWAYEDVIPHSLNNINNLLESSGTYNYNNFLVTGNVNDYDEDFIDSNYQINVKNILLDMGIVINGVYREKNLNSGVYNLMEKYMRTTGNAKDGLYFYSFEINSNKRDYQPSGGMNVNKSKYVQFEYNIIEAPLKNKIVASGLICDASGQAIGFRKQNNEATQYSFDLRVFEERYNILFIKSGKLGLIHAR